MITKGAITKKRSFTVRSATKEDIVRLEKPRQVTSHVTKLRHSHQMVCRLTAMGLSRIEIARQTGYTVARITQIQQSPAAQNQIAEYKNDVDQSYKGAVDAFFEVGSRNMLAAARHISDRIDELDANGELLGIREALAVVADGADRFGYGKKQTNVNINADLGTVLEKRLLKLGKTIDGSLSSRPPSGSQQPTGDPSPTSAVEMLTLEGSPSSQNQTAQEESLPQPRMRRLA